MSSNSPSNASSASGGRDSPPLPPPDEDPLPPPPEEEELQVWQEFFDKKANRKYYYNPKTKETVWKRPRRRNTLKSPVKVSTGGSATTSSGGNTTPKNSDGSETGRKAAASLAKVQNQALAAILGNNPATLPGPVPVGQRAQSGGSVSTTGNSRPSVASGQPGHNSRGSMTFGQPRPPPEHELDTESPVPTPPSQPADVPSLDLSKNRDGSESDTDSNKGSGSQAGSPVKNPSPGTGHSPATGTAASSGRKSFGQALKDNKEKDQKDKDNKEKDQKDKDHPKETPAVAAVTTTTPVPTTEPPVSPTNAASPTNTAAQTQAQAAENDVVWIEYVDASSGDKYYHNEKTKETVWTLPAAVLEKVKHQEAGSSAAQVSPPSGPAPSLAKSQGANSGANSANTSNPASTNAPTTTSNTNTSNKPKSETPKSGEAPKSARFPSKFVAPKTAESSNAGTAGTATKVAAPKSESATNTSPSSTTRPLITGAAGTAVSSGHVKRTSLIMGGSTTPAVTTAPAHKDSKDKDGRDGKAADKAHDDKDHKQEKDKPATATTPVTPRDPAKSVDKDKDHKDSKDKDHPAATTGKDHNKASTTTDEAPKKVVEKPKEAAKTAGTGVKAFPKVEPGGFRAPKTEAAKAASPTLAPKSESTGTKPATATTTAATASGDKDKTHHGTAAATAADKDHKDNKPATADNHKPADKAADHSKDHNSKPPATTPTSAATTKPADKATTAGETKVAPTAEKKEKKTEPDHDDLTDIDQDSVTEGASDKKGAGWTSYKIRGQWNRAAKWGTKGTGSRGGCYPNNVTWRDNPQYRICLLNTPKEGKDAKVAVFIELTMDKKPKGAQNANPAIGFSVLKNEGTSMQKLAISATDSVAKSGFVRAVTAVAGHDISEGKQNPASCEAQLQAFTPVLPLYLATADKSSVAFPPHYTLMPSTFDPGCSGSFTLTVHSKEKVFVKRLADSERWSQASVSGEWKGTTAGGCRNHKTFSNNPHYTLSASSSGRVIVVLSQPPGKEQEAIGFYVQAKSGLVTAKAAFLKAPEVTCEMQFEPTMAPYTVVPCTFDPGKEAHFSLSAHSAVPLTLTVEKPGDKDKDKAADKGHGHSPSITAPPVAVATASPPTSGNSALVTEDGMWD